MSEDLRIRIDRAEALLQQGQLPSAYFALKKVLRKEPHNVHALILSAELRLRDRKQTESVDLINKLFDLGGDMNLRKGGVMPVAILGSSTFDVTDIDVPTLRLEGVAPTSRGKSPLAKVNDVAVPLPLVLARCQAVSGREGVKGKGNDRGQGHETFRLRASAPW